MAFSARSMNGSPTFFPRVKPSSSTIWNVSELPAGLCCLSLCWLFPHLQAISRSVNGIFDKEYRMEHLLLIIIGILFLIIFVLLAKVYFLRKSASINLSALLLNIFFWLASVSLSHVNGLFFFFQSF